jgi:hypothetical protein
MLQISKEIAHKLHKKYGVRWKDGGISTSTTKYKKYYLCESEYNLKSLLKITDNEKVKKLLEELKNNRRFYE